MDHKVIAGNAITAVMVAVVMGAVAWGAGVFNAGSTAVDVEQIRAVIREEHIRDNGTTYGAALASIDGSLIAINTNLDAIRDDVDDLENAVTILASE